MYVLHFCYTEASRRECYKLHIQNIAYGSIESIFISHPINWLFFPIFFQYFSYQLIVFLILTKITYQLRRRINMHPGTIFWGFVPNQKGVENATLRTWNLGSHFAIKQQYALSGSCRPSIEITLRSTCELQRFRNLNWGYPKLHINDYPQVQKEHTNWSLYCFSFHDTMLITRLVFFLCLFWCKCLC